MTTGGWSQLKYRKICSNHTVYSRNKGEKCLKSPLALVILDGWGISSEQRGNALRLAEIPYFTHLQNNNPHT